MSLCPSLFGKNIGKLLLKSDEQREISVTFLKIFGRPDAKSPHSLIISTKYYVSSPLLTSMSKPPLMTLMMSLAVTVGSCCRHRWCLLSPLSISPLIYVYSFIDLVFLIIWVIFDFLISLLNLFLLFLSLKDWLLISEWIRIFWF